MKTNTHLWMLLLNALPALTLAQGFKPLPERSLNTLQSLHSCSYHEILPEQVLSDLAPEQLGPIVGISVDGMDGTVFKLGKYFRPNQQVRFYADDEAHNVQVAEKKQGAEIARYRGDVLQLAHERSLSAVPLLAEEMFFDVYQVSLIQQGKTTHQQRLIRMCQL
ncbi:hypothetical protein LVJ82_05625 [Vitreoscilla massiliensis]|uniref:Uncharacterized protein n=1 Tax=Vitreoscilla massiliensis TaxID=1689272 RepID=A0ABY4E3X1_9NEIS|nr:hypothetical protein [Vitreoscilla massiliensis]UOO90457.1 hypothetical protein LVJ82_05625 [Vitreoscilla massiliensis]